MVDNRDKGGRGLTKELDEFLRDTGNCMLVFKSTEFGQSLPSLFVSRSSKTGQVLGSVAISSSSLQRLLLDKMINDELVNAFDVALFCEFAKQISAQKCTSSASFFSRDACLLLTGRSTSCGDL
jgi:hypothetical protein